MLIKQTGISIFFFGGNVSQKKRYLAGTRADVSDNLPPASAERIIDSVLQALQGFKSLQTILGLRNDDC